MKCMSPVYVRKMQLSVPCGKCAFCLKKAIDAWCLRLEHEMEVSSSAFFLTLTYNDDHIPEGGNLSKRDLQLWIKRLRKVNKGIRYFAVGEYGTQFTRPHYHVVLFNLLDLSLVSATWTDRDGVPIGYISGSRATAGRIRYMVSYMATPAVPNDLVKPFRLMSRRPGIGANYVEKFKHWHRARSDSVVYKFDTPNAMPRYYKDKIYTNPHQKEMVRFKAMKYSEKHPSEPCVIQHDRLLKKLNRKQNG